MEIQIGIFSSYLGYYNLELRNKKSIDYSTVYFWSTKYYVQVRTKTIKRSSQEVEVQSK